MKKSILYLLFIVLLASCGGPRGDSAGIINGKKIANSEFIRAYQTRTIDYRSIYKHAPDAEEKLQIFENTWLDIAQHVILMDYFKKYQIHSNEKEVLDSLSANIPLVFRESNLFKVNGVFDMDMYLSSVHNDSPFNMADTRKQYLDYYIPIQKLKPYIIDNELLDSKKRKELAEAINSKADFELVVFDPTQLKLSISESELRNYYQKNMERYALPAVYELEYIKLPIQMQEYDLQYSRAVADSIYQELSYGRNLDALYQEKRTHLAGLTLSEAEFVPENMISEELLGILDLLPDNKTSRLIPYENGYIIYQKMQRTKSMIRYRHLQIPPLISPATVEGHYEAALGAMELAKSLGMRKAAQELDSPLEKTATLSLGDNWYPDELIRKSVESKLPGTKKGDYLSPIYSPATCSWVIVYLTDNKVNKAQAFSQVKQEIEEQLFSERKQELARQKAQNWLLRNPDYKTDKDSPEYELMQYQNIGSEALYKGEKLDRIYLNAMLAKKAGKSLFIQSLGEASVILIPKKIYPPAKNKIAITELREYFLRSQPVNWFELWLNGKVREAKIEIYTKP
ncbi:MAG: peptidylprolyl isomerase [Candidatus Cloacimonetes bacterium]|nr:peptidylprolyl isomerase [Candidatus Cloacimonadota bacterium]